MGRVALGAFVGEAQPFSLSCCSYLQQLLSLLRKRSLATRYKFRSRRATYHSCSSLSLQLPHSCSPAPSASITRCSSSTAVAADGQKQPEQKAADKPSAAKSDAPAKPQATSGSLAELRAMFVERSTIYDFRRFQAEPELAEAYHRGFREQARGWPRNPLDDVIAQLQALPSRAVVADMGCGDARLAAELRGRHDVRSFDLVATAPGVIACNIERTPLKNGECASSCSASRSWARRSGGLSERRFGC